MPKQSCNWCFTINNPSKVKTCGEKDKFKDLTFDTDEKLVQFIMQYDEVNYYVFQREKGHNENTEHIQGFIQFRNRKRGTTISNMFPPQFFHGEFAHGTAQQAADYCKKSDTRVGEVHEWGELRNAHTGGKQVTNEDILQRIKDGCDDIKLLEEFPHLWGQVDRLQKVRDMYVMDKWKNVFRDVYVTYICGQSGTGKTRGVMEEYGYSNVYRITDYKHPFDSYHGQDVIVFEEFRNSLPIDSMLNYLDGYPLELPARYANKIACFTKVYIISNWDFNEQYTAIQQKYFETWNAFVRRINCIKTYKDNFVFEDTNLEPYKLKHNLEKEHKDYEK
ncbi:MAG: replication protein [Ruminococcus sp.]|nr:replication protein [Ruminococcus sp.]